MESIPASVWIAIFTLFAFVVGVLFFVIGIRMIPRWLEALTPHIDESKEILKGNQAVASYFGMVVGAAIIGFSIIIAAAIVAGIHGY